MRIELKEIKARVGLVLAELFKRRCGRDRFQR